jgi:hypothetical protein
MVLLRPEQEDANVVNRQILKLTRPFVLGLVLRNLNSPDSSLLYTEMSKNTKNESLIEAVAKGSIYGEIKGEHTFKESIWLDGVINSQSSS